MKQEKTTERDQFTIILEDLHSNFKILGEGLAGLNEKMDRGFARIDKELNSHTEMIGQLMIEVGEIKIDLNHTKEDVREIRVDLNHTKEDVREIRIDVKEIKEALKQKTDQRSFVELENRVVILERGAKV